ncbi:MAG: FAD-dependent oxidoreductase [Burkholderiales bacterium]|nr:FAD-dependent oxidoreductase [Burkholderiales bacterium]
MTHQLACDILILGAGPAGLAAAHAAASSGLSIVLVDDNPMPGGQIWRNRPGHPSEAQAHLARLANSPNVKIHSGTRCVHVNSERHVLLQNNLGAWFQTCQKLIVCSGARELLLPFPGWTLPGVTGAGGLQALIKAGVPVDGQRLLIAGSGPLLLATAHTAGQAGAHILCIAEQAPWHTLLRVGTGLWRWPSKLRQTISLLNTAYSPGSHVIEALGDKHVEAVRVRCGQQDKVLACERIACGYGLIPNTELAQALGMALNNERSIAVDDLQMSSVQGLYAAGECTGIGGAERALAQGAIAGFAATDQLEKARALMPQRRHWDAFAAHLREHLKPNIETVKALNRPDTVVCRCEDVRFGELCDRTGWIDAKLHTRCGMGPCQGRVCGAATTQLFDWTSPPVRPQLAPIRISSLLQEPLGH